MERLVVEGGWRLSGKLRITGAKNATLPILAATLLSSGECIIEDAPRLRDVWVMKEILRLLGARVETSGHTIKVDARSVDSCEVPGHLMRQMRSTIFLMGPLLGRFKKVRVSYPGGCTIGNRPIDLHLKGLEILGADITERHGYIYAQTDGLVGNEIHLDFPSVGATENIMMAAVTAKGESCIRNAAKEPEIVDLQNFLNNMGANIKGAGTDVIRIKGVSDLSGTQHVVIPDRIVAGTLMIAAAITKGDIILDNVIEEHLEPVIAKLREAGVVVEEDSGSVRVVGPAGLRAVETVRTLPYPGFPTDLQAPMMSLLTVARGTSVITETVFDGRMTHVDELRRMGANITLDGRTAIICGVKQLTGAVVEASDLRAGAALVLAGLVADGRTIVEGVHHIDRGYEKIEASLAHLGADIYRTRETSEEE